MFIRGENPVKDLKYNIDKHHNLKIPNEPYLYGTSENSIGTIQIDYSNTNDNDIEVIDTEEKASDYEILSDEELEKYISDLNVNSNTNL